jgi:tRNA(Ile)-lysidine synthase
MNLLPLMSDRVHVLTIDHGFRAEAAAEAQAVARSARALGLIAHVEHLGLAPGPGAAERARDARLAAAERVREREGLDLIATGHTRTDHVETILFRAARGTGRTGALGIAPRRDRLVRPLLCASRAEVREWCTSRGIPFVDDPSNLDMATARARVRHGLMPALDAVHPGAEANLARFAALLADEADVVDQVVQAASRHVRRGSGLDASRLREQPVAVARLLVRGLLADAGLPADARGAEVVDAVLARAASGVGALQVPGGMVCVDRGVLVAEAAGGVPIALVPTSLPVPGAVRVPGLRVAARMGRAGITSAESAWVHAHGPLVVRAPEPGDRLALRGGGHQSLGRLLQAAGVPARHRAGVAVVADERGVLWVAGHRASSDVVAPPGEPAVNLTVMAEAT